MGVEPGKSKNEAAGNMVKDMKSVLDETHKALFKTVEQMEDKAERRHSKAPNYKNSWQLVEDQLLFPRMAPYMLIISRKAQEPDAWVTRRFVTKPNVVELELPKQMRVVPMANISRVKPYKGPIPGQRVD
ncbi:hypothetical protein SERLA73DRAFT_74429 [Serpula lacrymans var. lacrymans S7.3]|uniref:Uncharacterized protein n=1 Tax=Serpula lacrymans var. lacrymans (strain S7.3) TaxID=936435 RepID=F8Q1L9_SERL3|nr:hypothetical protein SERLA73DRAFT_74429 [Serpula lacrymans var. lacrymans S7.3]